MIPLPRGRDRGGVVWYVSSHGWGHASRQREVIREVLLRRPGMPVTVVTGVPSWFWAGLPGVDLETRITGPIPVERYGAVDTESTRRALESFQAGWRSHSEKEREFLCTTAPRLVVSDIDAVPFRAALEAGIPAVGLASFTWDWIFRNIPGCDGRTAELLAELYSGGHYLRLPLGPREHPFDSVEDMPLLPGGRPDAPERARELLGPGDPVLVCTLREPGAIPGGLSAPGWRLVTSLPEPVPGCDVNLPPDRLGRLGLRFADLVACADTVLLTPGYGIVSLVTACGVRAVVAARHGFPETPHVLGLLSGRAGTVFREACELAGDGLSRAASMSMAGPSPAPGGFGGIHACASRLLAVLDSGTGRPAGC